MGQSKTPPKSSQQTFVTHLVELRDRLLRLVMAVAVVFLILMPFANTLYIALAMPLMESLPEGATMIATDVASPFLTPFKFALVVAFFLVIPYVLYQMWAFIVPGLYASERRIVLPLLVSSSVLFYMGVLFAYFVVFPLVFGFLTGAAPEGVAVMTDISRYLDFVIKLLFAFGMAFEVPVATVLLIVTGVSSVESLAKKRPYVIVGAFVIGMLLTPPDAVSQTLLAIPMWLLFEVGLFASRFFVRRGESESEASDSNSDGDKRE